MSISPVLSLVARAVNQAIKTDPEGDVVQGKTSIESTSASSTVRQKDESVGSHIGEKIIFNELSLKSSFNDAKINLIGKYQSMVIYESLTSHSISGAIKILDTEGLLEKFLIMGGEELTIKVSKSTTNELLIWREDLVVHKMEPSAVDETTLNSSITLQFTTKTFIRSLKKRYFKSFKGNKFVTAIGEIFGEVSPNSIIVKDPELSFSTLKPFISTGLSPLNLIHNLAKKACSKGDYYVFFERFIPITNETLKTSASHYFGSLKSLIDDAQNNVYTITFQPKLSGYIENNLGANTIRTVKFVRLSNFNHIDAMLTGLYNTKITSINVTGRDYGIDKIDYVNQKVSGDFYESRVVSTKTIFGTYDDFKHEMPGEKLIVSSEHAHDYPKSKWLKRQIYGQITSNLFKIEVVVEGGTNRISTGSIVEFKVPSHFKKILNPSQSKIDDDIVQSGRYLVTSVRHDFKNDTYSKTLELSRGSLNLNSLALSNNNTAQVASNSSTQLNSSQNTLDASKNVSIQTKTTDIKLNTQSLKNEPTLSSVVSSVTNTTTSVKFIGTSTSIKRTNTGTLDTNSIEIVKALGIRLYGDSLPTSSNAESNIRSIFKNIIEREPNSTELAYWLNEINVNKVTLRTMQTQLAASSQSIEKYDTNPLKLYTSKSLVTIAKSISNGDWNNLNTAIITLYPDNVNTLTEEILTINRQRLQAKL
jgi:hypothetical protein